MELLKDRIDVILEAAKVGDKEAQLKLAKHFLKGTLVEKSVELAQYWSFKAAEQDYKPAAEFYEKNFNKKL